MPLSLRRKVGESILIGNDTRITVTRTKNTSTTLLIEAPKNVKIMREEVYFREKANLVTDGGEQPTITIGPQRKE